MERELQTFSVLTDRLLTNFKEGSVCKKLNFESHLQLVKYWRFMMTVDLTYISKASVLDMFGMKLKKSTFVRRVPLYAPLFEHAVLVKSMKSINNKKTNNKHFW